MSGCPKYWSSDDPSRSQDIGNRILITFSNILAGCEIVVSKLKGIAK
jgi:hypothetical protein